MATGLIAGGIIGLAAATAAFSASDSYTRRNIMRKTRRLARKASNAIEDSFNY